MAPPNISSQLPNTLTRLNARYGTELTIDMQSNLALLENELAKGVEGRKSQLYEVRDAINNINLGNP